MRHKKGFLLVGAIFLLICLLMNTMSSCSMMAQSIGSAISGSTYPSDDPELVAVEADYAAREAALQAEIDNIESSHPGYDEYRYDLDMIGHDPHELAAYLSAVLQGYTRQSAQAELERVFNAQYQLTLTEEVEVRYRTETRTDSEGNSYNRSYQANSACKEAIEQAISAHYAENRLDTEAAVKDVLEKFGAERVQFILANTIQHKNHDGRISQDNKAWAKTIPMPEDSGASRHCAYLVVDGVNPGLIDLFTRQARKAMQEQQKSSVLQKLKQEPPARKPAAPKKREPER